MKFKLEPIKVSRGIVADTRKLTRAIENTLSATALGVKADFGVVTQTWSKRPAFTITKKLGERVIRTTDEVFGYVDRGTRPHIIRSRSGKGLSFRSGYRAKTRPRTIGSTSGGALGDWVHAKAVRHPGTEARKFSEEIAKKWSHQLPQLLQRSIDSEL